MRIVAKISYGSIQFGTTGYEAVLYCFAKSEA